MHIFSRTRLIDPGQVKRTIALASEVYERTGDATGIDTVLSTGMLGYEPHALIATARIDTVADFDGYAEVLSRSEREVGLGEDAWCTRQVEESLTEVLAASRVAAPTPYNAVISATRDAVASDAAIRWGVEVAEYVSDVTDRAVIFGRVPFGDLGELRWWLGFDDADQIDSAFELLDRDPGFAAHLEGGGRLLRAGSTCRISKQVEEQART